MAGFRDSCPPWCALHSPARCRSQPEVIRLGRPGPDRRELAVQLEGWHGREVALVLLLAEHPPVYLPQQQALCFMGAASQLVAAAGWVPAEVRP